MSSPASPCALADPASPFRIVKNGLEVRLRVTPKASHDAIGDIVADEQGNGAIKLAVTAVPEKGMANKAIIRLLAKQWRLRKSDLAIVLGQTDRHKVLLIAGDGEQQLRHVTSAMSS